MSKVLRITSDLTDKDLIYSMEKFINSNSFRRFLSLTLLFSIPISGLCFIETKRFDAKPPPRAQYLLNTRPQPLLYAEPVEIADRRVLLSLATIPSTPQPVNEQNATVQPEIPLIAYDQDEISIIDNNTASPTNSKRMKEDGPVLPVADPFAEDEVSNSINSTDDLLDLFEQNNQNQNISSGYNMIPFIPPFTSAPDNLRVESSASYRKVMK